MAELLSAETLAILRDAAQWDEDMYPTAIKLLGHIEALQAERIPLERVLERVRTVLAAHNGETLDTYTAGIIEVEIISNIANKQQ